ncbi:hypothetical protein HPB50_009942 [Hyalomma asiaticum]|uniref:Uncharacterized protein n=1 Tax=Hyalomma asiaticum TaxID=266040 RepID=A0ACB7TID7_HYAAI|nr:hypothetical protein HPB50_009942 [Hyalomma asiaticum]
MLEFHCTSHHDGALGSLFRMEESSSVMPVAEDTDESVGASSVEKTVELHTLKKVANNKILPEVHAGKSSSAAQSPEKALTDGSDALFSSDGDDPGTCGGDMSDVFTPELTPHSAASSSLPSSMSSSRKCTPVSKTTITPKPCKQSHMEKAAEFNDLHTEPLDATLFETAFRKDGEKSSFPTDPEFLDADCCAVGHDGHNKVRDSARVRFKKASDEARTHGASRSRVNARRQSQLLLCLFKTTTPSTLIATLRLLHRQRKTPSSQVRLVLVFHAQVHLVRRAR